jgi:hypothetical protein
VGFELSTTSATVQGEPLFAVFESLETNYQDERCFVDLQCFGSLHVIFAFAAVPLIVFVKLLRSLKLL